MLIPSLNSSMFSVAGWVHDGSASPYEFRVANKLAVAARIDNYSVKGLHIGVSGFVGNTFRNDIITDESSSRYADVRGTVAIGGLDFSYTNGGLILRGSGLYGYLSDCELISVYNSTLPHSSQAPYPQTLVGQAAWSAGGEVGYDIFHHLKNPKMDRHKLYLFARYEYYDSYIPGHAMTDYEWTNRHCISGGLNYSPIKQIVIKAEGGIRLLKEQYNQEPWCALGITWAGMFSHEFHKR